MKSASRSSRKVRTCRTISRRHQLMLRQIQSVFPRMKALRTRFRLEQERGRVDELHQALATGVDTAPMFRRWEDEEVRRVWTECQGYCIEAVKCQRKALELSKHAYLDEAGAGQMMDAVQMLLGAAQMLSTVAVKVRREVQIRRRELPKESRGKDADEVHRLHRSLGLPPAPLS